MEPILREIFCAAGKYFEKQVKKGVFKPFLEIFDEKIAFFLARASSSKLVILAPKALLEKF